MGEHRLPGGRMEAVERLGTRPGVLRLRCGVQHYAWGDPEFIPRLLGIDNLDGRPFAELWIGAHPDLPAEVLVDGGVRLDHLIAMAPERLLGQEAARHFGGRLPFLLKILAAAQPLSIQVHPDRRQAQAGFERENRLGVPLDDPRRNYHDPNHKPELLCALTPFFALRGFRPLEAIGRVLGEIPEFEAISRDYVPTPEGLAAWYGWVMRMDQSEVDQVLEPLLNRLHRQALERPYRPSEPEYWALQADAAFSVNGHRDRGLFSIFVLNLLRLEPGQAIFLPAGELHAYLQGAGVEVMANSNNVLRGGLTPKHVDVNELLKVVRFRGGVPEVIQAQGPATGFGHGCYCTPVEEFELHRLRLGPDHVEREATSAMALAVVTVGRVRITAKGAKSLDFDAGQCYLVPHGVSYSLGAEQDSEVYMATIPRR